MINGQVVLREGGLTTVDVSVLAERHNRLAAALLDG